MRWQGRPESKNIEDRRDDPPEYETGGFGADGDFETGGGFGGPPFPPKEKPTRSQRDLDALLREENAKAEYQKPAPRSKPKNTGSKREYPKN